MFEKLEQDVKISEEPMDLYVETEEVKTIDEEYASLSWLDRLIIFLKALFLSSNRGEMTKIHIVNRIARQVYSVCPDYVDIKHQSLNGSFCNLLVSLANSVDYLRAPLSVCFEIDKKRLYSLMGQLEFPSLTDELNQKMDPYAVARQNPAQESSDIRKQLNNDMEILLARISREERLRMMELTRTLSHLYKLSQYSFKPLISQFPNSPDGKVLPAGYSGLAKGLTELAEILTSFHKPPSIKLMEAVLLVYYSSLEQVDKANLEGNVSEGIKHFENMVQTIRNFNKAVPLIDLLKVIHEDPFFRVVDLGGGEDWFFIYRDHWQDILSEKLRVFSREKSLEDLTIELLRYWDLESMIPIIGYSKNERLASFGNSLAALNTFFHENYQKKLYYPMKIILVDGNFYKKNNRADYEKYFQILVKIGERTKWFETYLQPEGEAGRKIRNVNHEYRNDQAELEQQILMIYNGVNRDALLVLEDSLHCLMIMGKLMNGVALGDGGSYDTLSNLSELGGRKNDELRQSIMAAADDIHKIAHTLQDLMNLEKEIMEELISKARK